jgi:hypothetical protein
VAEDEHVEPDNVGEPDVDNEVLSWAVPVRLLELDFVNTNVELIDKELLGEAEFENVFVFVLVRVFPCDGEDENVKVFEVVPDMLGEKDTDLVGVRSCVL